MLRNHCNKEELEAHRILDLVRVGDDVSETSVRWALRVLGDGLGLGWLHG